MICRENSGTNGRSSNKKNYNSFIFLLYRSFCFRNAIGRICNQKGFAVFFTGMLEPRPSDGGVLGPTFQCILAEQFKRLRVGDRFWHENDANPSLNTDRTAFNVPMLREIRKTTFARILCDNADSITAVNKMVFLQSKERVGCDQLETVSFNPWITPHRDSG